MKNHKSLSRRSAFVVTCPLEGICFEYLACYQGNGDFDIVQVKKLNVHVNKTASVKNKNEVAIICGLGCNCLPGCDHYM